MQKDYRIKYVSASGDTLDLSGGGIDAIGTPLFEWSYETVTINNRLAGFSRGMPEYELGVVIVCGSDADGIAARNRLYELPAQDRSLMQPGRLYVNDWYIRGFMTASAADNFWQTRTAAQYVLTFTATEPKWVRETERTYALEQTSTSAYLDFPYDFAYDYGFSRQVATVTNDNFSESPAIIRMYGVAENPSVTIGGNVYKANVTLSEGDYLELDGMTAKAVVRRSNGLTENAFPYLEGEFAKGSGSFAFQPLPAGVSEVQWDGSFDLDVVVLEQRDEPRWS